MQISLRLIESLRKLTGIDYYRDIMPTWLLQTGTIKCWKSRKPVFHDKLLPREEIYPRMTHLIGKYNATFQAAKRAPIELS